MNFVNYVRTLEVSSNFSMFFVLERLWESWNKQFSKLNKTNFEQARLSDRKKRNHKTRNKSSGLLLTPKTVLQPIFTRVIQNSDNFIIFATFLHWTKFLYSLDFSALNARLLSTNPVKKISLTWTRHFATRADSFQFPKWRHLAKSSLTLKHKIIWMHLNPFKVIAGRYLRVRNFPIF